MCSHWTRFRNVIAWLRTSVAGSLVAAAIASSAPGAEDQSAADDESARPYPHLATAETLANPQALARLATPGDVFFRDDFESPESLKKYFEIRGLQEGRAKLTADPALAHSGSGAIQFTAVARDGRESGVGASGWFGPEGYDRVYFRRYIKFAADYDQGNLNHVGGGLAGVAGADR